MLTCNDNESSMAENTDIVNHGAIPIVTRLDHEQYLVKDDFEPHGGQYFFHQQIANLTG